MAKKAYVYSGTDWVPLASEVTDLTAYSTSTEIANTYATKAENGLVHIETQTLSAVTSVSFSNDIFTSNYDNYLFVAYLGAPSNGQITIRLRSAGSDNATANYDFQYIAANNTTVSGARFTGQTSARAAYMDTNTKTAFNMTLYNPKVSDVTVYHVESFGGLSGAYIENYIGKFALTTSFDSISFLCAANLTGSISVYGYRK